MAVLSWLNADQNRYLFVAQVVLFAFTALAVACAFSPRLDAKFSGRRGTTAFLALAFLALVAARWPTFFVTHELNPDEAEMVANAITVPFDPVAWVGFDGLTSGPLNTYALDLSLLFGQRPSFESTHIVAGLMIFVALAALYAAACSCFDRVVARVAIVPPLVFWAVSTLEDFTHYSSELLSLTLCSVMVALIARSWRRGFSLGSILAIGFVSGFIPFAKLQAAPLALASAGVLAVAVLAARSLTIRAKGARFIAFAAGAAIFPIAFLAFVAAGGGLRDFWISYVLSSLAYILFDDQPLSFLTQSPEFGVYFDWLFLFTCAGALVAFLNVKAPNARARVILAAALLILVGGVEAAYSPRRGSPHYLLYAVIPAATAAAAALYAIMIWAAPKKIAGIRRGCIALAFTILCLGMQGALVRAHYPWIGLDFDSFFVGGPHDDLTRVIEKHIQPGQRLAIWGWQPEYYVYTSTLLGTRDSVCANQYATLGNPYRDYFRARYVADFQRIRPAGFLDAGAESWDQNVRDLSDDYKSFPELAAVVDRDYVLADTYHRFKLYVRKDLAVADRAGLARSLRRSSM